MTALNNETAIDQKLSSLKERLLHGEGTSQLLGEFTALISDSFSYAQVLKADKLLNRILAAHRLNAKASGFQEINVALLGNFTITQLIPLVRVYILKYGFFARVYQNPYGSMENVLLDTASDYFSFQPAITIIYTNARDIRLFPDHNSSESEAAVLAEREIARLESLWKAISASTSSLIIQNNFETSMVRVYGNLETRLPFAKTHYVMRCNENLIAASRRYDSVLINDLDHISSLVGKRAWFDNKFWYHSQHQHSIEHAGESVRNIVRIIAVAKGKTRKCIVLDLDNTLWGGVVGDDGLGGIILDHSAGGQAYVDFQKYLLELKKRGVILAVCSKNDEITAREVFEKHENMVLRMDDIACFVANWDNKADNIRKIAGHLNIGMDSLVFVDDNPAERDMVRTFCPEVHVIEMPDDPAEYVTAIDSSGAFETVALSEDDAKRTQYYRENKLRQDIQVSFSTMEEYLRSLSLEGTLREFDEEHLQRIVQLINKTNQFNLTTRRYTAEEVRRFLCSEKFVTLSVKLKDKFGEYGLISVLIARKEAAELVIDTWLMSCRVLNKGVEHFVFNRLVDTARKERITAIVGKYVPTKKNGMVKDLLPKLGFRADAGRPIEEDGSSWFTLPVAAYVPLGHSIRETS